MGSMKNNQKGFSAVEALIILVITGAIIAIGFYVWNTSHKDKAASTQNSQTATKTSSDKDVATATNKEYVNEEYGFSFSYPSSWKLTTELKDMGRGGKEGTVAVTSPNGTIVHFDPNFGGKGGDCVDPETDTRTTKTCQTFTSYKVEKLQTSSATDAIYYNQASLTAPTNSGGTTKYYIFITNNDYFPTTPSTIVGAVLQPYDEITTKTTGYVTINVEGKDDSSNTSQAFFATQEVKEAEPILKSFKLLN